MQTHGHPTMRTVCELASKIVVSIDVGGEVIQANENAFRVLGYSPDELQRCNWFEDVFCSQNELNSRVHERTHRVFTKAGQRINVSWTVNPLRLSDGSVCGYTLIGEEVSGASCAVNSCAINGSPVDDQVTRCSVKKDQADRVIESKVEQNYQDLVETMPHGILEVDLDGMITYVNPASAKMYGCAADGLIGRQVWDQIAERSAESKAFFATLIEFLPEQVSRVEEHAKSNGERFVVQIDWSGRYSSTGQLTGFVCVQTDITDRYVSDRKIRENERLFRDIMSSLRETTVVVYEQDGRISSMWEDAEKAQEYGIFAHEIIGKTIYDILSPAEAEARMEQVRTVIRTGEKLKSESVNTLNGVKFWYDSTLSPLVNDDGSITSAVGFLRDITEKRQSEMALRENESQLRSIMNSLQETTIFLYDYEGTITRIWSGQSSRERYQAQASDFVGKNLRDLLPPDQVDKRLQDIREVIDHRRTIQTHAVRELPGGKFHFDITLSPLLREDNTIAGAVGFVRDVTDHQTALEALRVSEKRFRTIMGSLHKSSITIYDRTGRIITMWGDSEQDKVYGLSYQDVIGKSVREILPQDEAELRLRQLEQVLENGVNSVVELHCSLPNGQFWIESSLSPFLNDDGEIVGVVGFGRDITDRKNVEQAIQEMNARLESEIQSRTHTLSEAVSSLQREVTHRKEIELKLRKSEESFRAIVETSTEWIWEVDLDFYHVYSNHRVQDILGFSTAEIAAIDFRTLFHPEDRAQNCELIKRHIEEGTGWTRWIKRIRHRDGRYRYIESSSTPIFSEQNELIGFRGVNRDITSRLKTEEQLEQHKESLARVARMGTMGATVSGLAHELNQPLSALSLYADACQKMRDPKHSVLLGNTLDKIGEQAERAGKIIRRVQEFSQQGTARRAPCQMNDIIVESIGFLKPDASMYEIDVIVDLFDELPLIVGDPVQLQQVMMNLLRNGLDSMIDQDGHERVLHIRSCLKVDISNGKSVVVIVRDSGAGFEESQVDQMFESFVTTKRDGMGLGLPISRSIIESHGGHISAKLNNDRGASFVITLPIGIRGER